MNAMAFRKDTPQDIKYRERRRGSRMNSRVRIALEWQDAAGQAIRQEAITRIVSPSGCLVVIKHDLALDQSMQLTNLDRNETLLVKVVWKGIELPEGLEHGLELTNTESDFWGLDL